METLQPRDLLTTAVHDGDWYDPNTWEGGVVPDENTPALISHGVTVQLDGAEHFARDLTVHGNLLVPEEGSSSTDANKKLTTRWVHVNSDGVFQVGTEQNRYDEGTFTLELTGIDVNFDPVIATNMKGMMPSSMTLENNDGFLMTGMGGSLQFYGEDKLSFTKLAVTADKNASEIIVSNFIERNYSTGGIDANGEFITSAADDGAVNWEINDQIVIASSSYDYTEEDVRTIVDIFDNGNDTSTIILNAPLSYRHFGEIETYGETAAPNTTAASQTYHIDMRAEVALLSRNVKIQGREDQDTDREFGDRWHVVTEEHVSGDETHISGETFTAADVNVVNRIPADGLSAAEISELPAKQVSIGAGGHIMIMGDSGQITVDGVQLDRLGQASQKGRYPIHWHLAGDRPNDVLRNTSVTNSNNRGVTIHGTSNLNIEGVVLHDIHGHGFFFEDAVETGNTLVGNIALGIHSVGGDDNSFANPGKEDPFVVDTHDSFRETGSRFKGSAAYWITNPTNTFIGNIAAGAGDSRFIDPDDNVKDHYSPGPAGTGFWYALPRTVLGASSKNSLFDEINPIFAEFGQFDYNTSHTTAVGLNFDRGSDIENGNMEGGLRTSHQPNEYSPRVGGVEGNPKAEAKYINGFTNYKASDAAVYHRGDAESIRFNGLRIADSYNGPWAVSENQYDNSLFVGHSSRNNEGFAAQVGGPRLYDGSGLYTNTHFAGFANENAYVFQVEGSSFGPTMYHAFRGSSFENDGTLNNIAHAVSDFTDGPDGKPQTNHNLGQPSQWIKAAIDLDGTLTSGLGGGIGASIVPNVDFLVDDGDTLLPGGKAFLTDDIYARMRLQNNDDGEPLFPPGNEGDPLVRFTAVDADSTGVSNSIDVLGGQEINEQFYWTQIATKADSDGDGFVEDTLVVEFMRNGLPTNGFVLNMDNQDGGRPELVEAIDDKVNVARLVSKFVGAQNYTPRINGVDATEVASEAELRSVTSGVAFFRASTGDLFLNTSIVSQPFIKLTPGDPLQTGYLPAIPNVTFGATIQAEEFDNGIDGIAYHDIDTTNSFGSFRSDTGVDVTPTLVGDIANGEWLEYTANITPGGYSIGVSFDSTQDTGTIRVLAANSNSAGHLREVGTIAVEDTGGSLSTAWIKTADLTFIEGNESVIRLEFVGDFADGFIVDAIEFDTPIQTASEDRTDLTIDADMAETRIKLIHFDNGGQGVAYYDTTPGNEIGDYRSVEDVDTNGDIVTNAVVSGEWLEYTVDIHAGLYDISLAKNWGGGVGAGVKLFIADSNSATELEFLDQFNFAGGGSEYITLNDVDLSPWAGKDRVIRAEIVGNNMGINYLDFVSKSQTAPMVDIVDVSPDPRNSDAGVVTINFDEDVTGVDSSDLTLTRNGETVDLSGLTVTQVTPSQYTVDLSTVTAADGTYELALHSTDSGIQDLAGNALGTGAVDQFFIDRTGPQVAAVVVNGGSNQRSMVSELTVTFSEEVYGVDANSFILMNRTTNTQVVPNVTTQLANGQTVATLTFSGTGIIGGSLADGDYTLTTVASNVLDEFGNQLDGDSDGNRGGDAEDSFFRLFGDANGDRIVGMGDFFQFRDAFGGSDDEVFDFDGDGKINIIDFFRFRSRFGQTI